MKTKSLYVALVMMLCGIGLHAQDGSMKATSHSVAEYVRNIPPLSSMKNIISAKGLEHKAAPDKRRGSNTVVPGKGLPKGNDPLADRQNIAQKRAIGRAPVANFDAHNSGVLNDPTGAIGPNHYVYAFNFGFGIKDRDGNVLLPEASLATLFPGEDLGDPIVMYDNFEDRFIIMEFSNSPNGILIAVGQGPDPVNDGWFTYRFNTGTFPDYEKLSIWSDGYYITANKDQNAPQTNDVVFVAERDKMLVGDASAQFIGFPLPGAITSGFYSPGGFNATGATLPPVGTGHNIVYMQDDAWAGVSQDHLKVWTTSVDWANPGNSTISSPQEIVTAPFDSVFDGGSFSNLPQPGGSDIDALQATMMFMTNYRRFAGHNSVVMNFVVDLDGNDDLSGIRWYELRQTGDGAPWTIYQEGTYVQPDGLSAFSGAINMDVDGNIGLGYTVVSSSVFTSIRYTGRLAADPLGTMTVAEETAVDGDATVPGFRYGDYAQMTMDPLDDRTFWHIGEYMKGSSNVRTSRVVAFMLEAGEPDEEAPSTPENLEASNTTAFATTLSWTASTDNVGVAGYDVYQDGAVVGTASGTTFAVTGLTPLTTYTFAVVAKDAAGNESGASSDLEVTTLENTGGDGCQGGTAAFPYGEGFEDTIGEWSQSTDDDLDWTVNTGATPSRRTGPSSAVEGSFYIFVEASGNGIGYPTKQATITSPCFDLTGSANATFSFQYHMFGSNSGMGSIDLEASGDDGETWVSLWSQEGNQGNSWNAVDIDLATYVGGSVQLRFNRITGTTWRADLALDAIAVTTDGARVASKLTTFKLSTEDTGEFTVYPSPTQNMLNVTIGENSIDNLQIFSMYGTLAKEISNQGKKKQIDVSDLSTGTYFVRFTSGEQVVTRKFVKE